VASRHHDVEGVEEETHEANRRPVPWAIPPSTRVVTPVAAIALIFVVLGMVKGARGDGADETAPVVGEDLHAVSEIDGRTFVSGHQGAGYRYPSGGWTQIGSLRAKDVMAWATTGSAVLAGGHQGLYRSSNRGSTFAKVSGLSVSDVHALGAAGDTLYLASPEAGVLVSTDGGRRFEQRGADGQAFMGTIWVDPSNPNIAIAPSMDDGAVKTMDGGATWTPMGGSAGAMAVAVRDSGSEVLMLGIGAAEASNDGGATWSPVDVPAGTRAASYTADGHLIAAVLAGDRAEVFEQIDGTWNRLR
jgi:hypothetical protein